LSKLVKNSTAFLSILLASTVLLLALNPIAYAQEDETAEVIIVDSVGGSTDPEAGTYIYDYGEDIVLTATPYDGFEFAYWVVHGLYTPGHHTPPINYPENYYADPDWVPDFPSPREVAEDGLVISMNPLTIKCGYGYTYMYQAVFNPTSTPPSTDAIVIVLDAEGGTTNPGPGTYTYLADQTVDLKATPSDGFEFQYWIATTTDVAGHDAILLEDTLAINCQGGYTYSYQPVFAPADSAVPSEEAVPTEYLYAIIVILAIVAVIAIAAALMYRSRK
jgi:hypothetical protein